MARRLPPPQLIGSGLIPQNFQDQYNSTENDYQGNLAELGRGERSLFQDYGFQGGIGEGGAVNFGVNPNAQFGQYQSLLRNFGGQLGQAKKETQGRGLGRAGLSKARENLIRFMMSGEKANLATGFSKAAGDIFGKRGGALTNRNRRFSDIEGGALDWWNQYGPDDPDGTIPENVDPASNLSPYEMPTPMPDFSPQAAPAEAQWQPAYGMVGSNPGDTLADIIPGYTPPRADPYTPAKRRTGGGSGNVQTM